MRRPVIIIMLALTTIVWTSALAAAPASLSPRLAAATYAAGALLCHQRPERSFHIAQSQLPVCARCFGLYAGAIVGTLLWAGIAGLRHQASSRARRIVQASGLRTLLILCAIPTGVTVVTASLGGWDPANAVRALLAVPLGAAIAAVVTAVSARDLR